METQPPTVTPVLGSSLLRSALPRRSHIPEPLSSGSAFIDGQALRCGFRYGEITSIAGAHGTGKTTIAFQAIASHLLSSPNGEVAVIDTSGTFSPVRLRDVLALRLREQRQRTSFQQSGYVYAKRPADPEPVTEELAQEATSMLDRVKLMRVFDVAGLVEAVGEITESCEQLAEVSAEIGVLKRGGVADSEDELSEDDIWAESEGLESGDPAQLLKSQNSGIIPIHDGRIGMVVIDTIADIFGPLMGKNQIQGQGLLTTFMRSVRHLTTRRRICTMVTNAVVGLGLSKNQQYQQRPEENASIFYSTAGKPALGKFFTHLIDTSIMLSTLPKTTEDADSAYGDNKPGTKPRYCSIFEVLHDKHDIRAENWVAFEIIDGLELRSVDTGRS